MKTVLIFTYYWPPSGGAAVQRWLSFANEIAADPNWKVVVIAPDPKTASFPFIDDSLVAEIHPKITVHHIAQRDGLKWYKRMVGKGKAPAPGFINENEGLLNRMARFIRGNFYFPDPRKNWLKGAKEVAKNYLKTDPNCRLVTAGPPHSTHYIGKHLKGDFPNAFWVADFHDAWTDIWYYDKLYKTYFARKLDRKMEISILQAADKVLTVGVLLKNKLIENSGIPEAKIDVVAMGYDAAIDFSDLSADNKIFKMAYVGTIDQQYEAGSFFESLSILKSKNLAFSVDFVGLSDESIQRETENRGLQDVVNFINYVPHKEAVQFLRKANLLLLVSPKVKSERLIIPGKLYEYIASEKSILNLGDKQSNTALLVEETATGKNFDRTEIAEMSVFLEQEIKQFEAQKAGVISPNVRSTHKIFSRSYLAQRIKEML
jgi:glycosyltransferase involved in cell wall biosynthesis